MISPPVSERVTAPMPVFVAEASKSGLRCVALETDAAFCELEPMWRELSDVATNRSPSLQWAWIWSWWSTFGVKCPKTGRKGAPYIVQVFDESHLVAVYPFMSQETSWWTPCLRRLRPIGYSGELEPSGLTEEALCLVAPGYEEIARGAVLAHVAAQIRRGRWDCAVVRQLNLEDIPATALKGTGFVASQKIKDGPQAVNLPETWAAFRKQLTKSMRDNLPYYPRLLTRAGHSFEVVYCQDSGAICEAGKTLVRLHKLRVFSDVGQTHQNYFTHAWQPEMLDAGFQALAREGLGFIAMLVVDGNAVAAQSFLETDSELLVHYSGFDPNFAKFSPLLVLQAEVFRRAIEEKKIRKINLLYGNAQWQKRWSSNSEGREAKTLLLGLRPMAIVRMAFYMVLRESVAFSRRSGLRRRLQRVLDRRP